jgi:hypothetical protein
VVTLLFHAEARSLHQAYPRYNATKRAIALSTVKRQLMKFLSACLLLAISFSACNKTNCRTHGDDSEQLIGKWKYTEQYSSAGGPGVWKPVVPANHTIVFEKSGAFKGAANFLQAGNQFTILDSMRVKITPAENASGYVIMQYQLSQANDELQLFPLEPARCIEGCSSKFVRD